MDGMTQKTPFSHQIPDAATFLAKTLEQCGFETFLVGGAVRDMSLNRPVTDWDLATDAYPRTGSWIFLKIFRASH